MPRGDPRQQIALYASSDVVVAPFGSNTANSVFMRPGSVFVEVTPLCASTCEEGCHPYSKPLSGHLAANPAKHAPLATRGFQEPRLPVATLAGFVEVLESS